jgi:hypothetical protein
MLNMLAITIYRIIGIVAVRFDLSTGVDLRAPGIFVVTFVAPALLSFVTFTAACASAMMTL